MNKEERLELENELLMSCSKAQAINKYIDELEENMILTNQWYKSQQENQYLKQQLEDKENIACNWKDSCLENAGKVEKLENQQKEFINYMNDIIDVLKKEDVDDEELRDYIIQRIDTFKEILQKYKEITGGK